MPLYRGLWACVLSIAREAPMGRAFFNGLVPSLIKSTVSTAAVFASYDAVIKGLRLSRQPL